MKKLLKRQLRWLFIYLLLVILSIGALIFLSFYPQTKDLGYQYFFYILIGVFGLLAILDFFISLGINVSLNKKKGKAEMKAAEIIGNDISEAYNFGEIGLAVCDSELNILWVNEFLSSRFDNLVDKKITDEFHDIGYLGDANYKGDKVVDGKVTIFSESHVYSVELLKEARLYIFRDITEYRNIFDSTKKMSPVIGYLCIDNYADVQINTKDENAFANMYSEIRSIIAQFGEETKSLMRRIKDDRYLFITTAEKYEEMRAGNFAIVDQVRAKFPGNFTISMGIALGFPEYGKLADMASKALDVALSRGGDQTVVSPFSKALEYFGGKTEMQSSRNKVKLRTMASVFMTIINDFSNVIIMGHGNADFDAIGSALGAYALCKQAGAKDANGKPVGIPAKICWDDQLVENKVRVAVESLFSKEEMDEMFVSLRNVAALVNDKTLLFAVDHNNPKLSIFPDIVKSFKHVAVVDHHRMGDVTFDNVVVKSVEPSASSASELLTYILLYSPDNLSVDPKIATMMLAGICLDTQNFKEKTSNNTFEAAGLLKSHGADGNKVVEYMKTDLEEYRMKNAIMQSADSPYYGCLVMNSPDSEIVSSVILAIVANEAMSISGISVSFCIGRVNEHQVKISARSDSTISVQVLMEKLGGGGHLNMAAAVFSDTTVGEVKEKLLAVLKDYLEDAKQNQEQSEE